MQQRELPGLACYPFGPVGFPDGKLSGGFEKTSLITARPGELGRKAVSLFADLQEAQSGMIRDEC